MSAATQSRAVSESIFPTNPFNGAAGITLSVDADEGEKLPEFILADNRYSCVTAGLVAISRQAPSGRRQILFLAFPGDWIAIPSGLFVECQATALIPSTIVSGETLSTEFLVEVGDISCSLIEQSRRLAEHSFRLGALSAMEAIALFIDQMKARQDDGVANVGSVKLYLSRTDIADYLGLTVETVSRTFSKLKRRGLIAFKNGKQVDMLRPSIFLAVCES